jgi:tRNA 2-selenouridine synthase
MVNPHSVEDADPATLARFDALIDVRSPAEFALDHAPSAINLPVLGDEERAVVGTIYVQDSRFRARRLGAALVARNIARHLETALADRPHDFKPLVYCWRGGQRSNAMATVLAQVGWSTAVLAGGYRTYRRRVQTRLYNDPLGLDLVLLDGGTGSGKTEVLQALGTRGVQVVDLEALAEHRGSLFGAPAGAEQPSQKLFESRLLAAIEALDPARPVVVEAESHKIGERMLPPALWRAMDAAPRIALRAGRGPRAEAGRGLRRPRRDARRPPRPDRAPARAPGQGTAGGAQRFARLGRLSGARPGADHPALRSRLRALQSARHADAAGSGGAGDHG